MHKNLLKFYMFSVIMLFVFINIFPSIFININNCLNYIKVKTLIAFEWKKDIEISIYKDRGNVIIALDDGWKTQYTVGYNYMHKKKMRGSIAVIPSLIGQNGYMNMGDLYKLYDDNWDLLNHTYSHIILSKNNMSKQTNDINKADEWFCKNGFVNPSKILIYPEGEYNSNTITIMRELNYISGRSTEDGFNPKMPLNLYDIKVKNVFSNTPPNDVNDWIDYTINNKLTLILLFHKLENDVDKSLMKYKKENFYKIVDYIDKKRDDLNIITYSEWMQTDIINK